MRYSNEFGLAHGQVCFLFGCCFYRMENLLHTLPQKYIWMNPTQNAGYLFGKITYLLALPTKAMIFVFRFIIEYSSLRDFASTR
jgi:hypothetical protein